MRYAIVSDIHANLPAWKAVQLDIGSLGVDRVVCLGDVVGYGPQPAEVLESVYASVHHFVLGNHDAVLCGKLSTELFNGPARRIMEWTATQLDGRARRVLAEWPLVLRGPGFRCAHGDFGAPERFDYVIDPEDARPSWQRTEDRLLFVGHTHSPGIYLLGHTNTPRRVEPQDCVVDGDRRFLVNVGSVGQPRDGDARACYVVWDEERRALRWRRIPFDLDTYREAVAHSGLPVTADYFLDFDPRRAVRPLRERLSFRPAQTAQQAARDAVGEQDLRLLKREISRWRRLAVAALVVFLLAGVVVGALAWRYHARRQELQGPEFGPVAAAAFEPGAAIVALPATGAGLPLPGWRVGLGNRYRQTAALRRGEDGDPVLALSSDTERDPITLTSRPVTVPPGCRLTAEALFRKGPDFRGTVALAVSVEREIDGRAERLEHFVVKEPNLHRRGGWMAARETFETPAGTRRLQVHVRGHFRGTVEISGLRLEARPGAGP